MNSVLSSFTPFFTPATFHVHSLTLLVSVTYMCVITLLEVLHLNTKINLISNFVYLCLPSCTNLLSVFLGICLFS